MRTLILGLDAFDPGVFERLYNQGRMPHLGRYVEAGGYARFRVSNPPQSEVSWTSIASGLNPGQHGLFDFVHREPASYALYVSLLPSRSGWWGSRFVRPSPAPTLFDQAARRGFPATSLWWPATFPALPDSPVRTLPGLGTPDLHGRLGVGTLFSTDPEDAARPGKTPAYTLGRAPGGGYVQELRGPARKTRGGEQATSLPLRLEPAGGGTAHLQAGPHELTLEQGVWSPILELSFRPGLWPARGIGAVTRAILTQVEPHVRLYVLPLQLHPLKSPWRYGTPGGFVNQVWQACGPFLTLGWPQDTQGLEDGILSDEQFLALCRSVDDARAGVLLRQLEDFREGVLGAVFDTLDRVQHMFRRDRPDIVEDWYVRMDELAGRAAERFAAHATPEDRLIIVSDHGFAGFDYKVHLNRWLMDAGYLAARGNGADGTWKEVDWPRTRAYAAGLNSVYLNLAGREGQGQVAPGESAGLADELRARLLAWTAPDGRRVVRQAWRRDEAFHGELAGAGPDLVLGYAPGYRASAQTGLGGWGAAGLEPNADHWGADHCVDPAAVPGVIFASRGLADFPNPSYADIPPLAIDAEPDATGSGPRQGAGGEDEGIVEERLRSLGYL
jgi:predicted AlkP superfamily phosphohydrolase/phosphomutase